MFLRVNARVENNHVSELSRPWMSHHDVGSESHRCVQPWGRRRHQVSKVVMGRDGSQLGEQIVASP
jgi:hypothetical protein